MCKDCGCNDCGKSSINGYNPNNNVTGNFKYDGNPFICDKNGAIDIVNGEGLNAIIQKILSSLCQVGNGGNYLAFTDYGKSLTAGIGVPQVLMETEFPIGEIKENQGLRIIVSGAYNTVVGGGLTLDLRRYGKDSGGVPTTPFPFATINIPANLGTDSFKYEITLIRKVGLPNEVDLWIKFETSNGTYSYSLFQGTAAVPDLLSNGLVIDFRATKLDALDSVSNVMMTVEHLR